MAAATKYTKPLVLLAAAVILTTTLILTTTSNNKVYCDNSLSDDFDNNDPDAIDVQDALASVSSSGAGHSTGDNHNNKQQHQDDNSAAKDKSYVSPKINPDGIYLYESFDDQQQFDAQWVSSADHKYEGRWQLNSGPDRPRADLQLLLPVKARHYAISSKLNQTFKFTDNNKPLVVQYEAQFRAGLDCGGAYVKLLRQASSNDLSKLNDKTPFTIMFGPDKCGSESKLHFIIQYMNPKTHEYNEKHWKQAKYVTDLASTFSDKKHHLYRLVLEPDGDFEISLDDKSVGKGNLLEDLEPDINPPKEIVDLNDKKPEDWDERQQIEDPNAVKPDDWDENAPKTIEDPNAVKPSDWLENEPKLIPDPEAQKPDDWDDQIDGEWKPGMIDNPACAKVSGCGEWKRPMIANPNYKGKWKAPKIDNPNYKGKWSPRNIPNPDYFFDEKPFASLDPIGAVAFELWSMADGIAFDNFIVADVVDRADLIKILTWQDKNADFDANSASLLTRSLHYLKLHPWLWAVVVISIALPLFLFVSYCCDTKVRGQTAQVPEEVARRKKTDAARPDDERDDDDEAGQLDDEEAVEVNEDVDEGDADYEEEEIIDDDEEGEAASGSKKSARDSGDKSNKRQVRQRKK